jgi:S1-C subfamily serine protease
VDYTSVLARFGFTGEIASGVLIQDVEKGSQAEAARLQGVIIIKVDGQEVSTPAEFYQKIDKVGAVELTLAGEGERHQTKKVTLD